jgi:hypothetical protein
MTTDQEKFNEMTETEELRLASYQVEGGRVDTPWAMGRGSAVDDENENKEMAKVVTRRSDIVNDMVNDGIDVTSKPNEGVDKVSEPRFTVGMVVGCRGTFGAWDLYEIVGLATAHGEGSKRLYRLRDVVSDEEWWTENLTKEFYVVKIESEEE